MPPKTVTPPAGAEAKPSTPETPELTALAGSGVDMEAAARQAIIQSAMQEIATDGVDLAEEFQPDPAQIPKPMRIHPKANYFPPGMEPESIRQRPPKPYMSSYPEASRLETVVVDQQRAIQNAQIMIAEARSGSSVAQAAIAEAEKAVAEAGDNVEAKEKAERSLAAARNAYEQNQQKGKKGVALLEAAALQLDDARKALDAETLVVRRQQLREDRWRNGQEPLSREEEDALLGVVKEAESTELAPA